MLRTFLIRPPNDDPPGSTIYVRAQAHNPRTHRPIITKLRVRNVELQHSPLIVPSGIVQRVMKGPVFQLTNGSVPASRPYSTSRASNTGEVSRGRLVHSMGISEVFAKGLGRVQSGIRMRTRTPSPIVKRSASRNKRSQTDCRSQLRLGMADKQMRSCTFHQSLQD